MKENFMGIKCYGICSEMCAFMKDGKCSIHTKTMSKEEFIERLSEVLPSDGEISFAAVTWWNDNGTFNWDTDSDTERKL